MDAMNIETPKTSFEPNLIEITAPKTLKSKICNFCYKIHFKFSGTLYVLPE
jgi:hypothetical protein